MRLLRGSMPGLFGLLCIAGASYAFAQLPKRVEKCLPYPTLAQEIRERQPAPENVKIHVARIEFDKEDVIPADVQEEISTGLQNIVFERNEEKSFLNELANEIAEVPVGEAFRSRGYFKVTATATATELWRDAADIGVVVAVRATLGPQYGTGEIRIESADPDHPLTLSSEMLRSLIPLQAGELFSTKSVREGLENIGRTYGREGYIDMTPEPDTMVDDARRIIDLVVKIDEQVQYHVGSIEFLGVSGAFQQKLQESLPKAGEVFDTSRLNEFFEINKAILPSDASRDDVNVRRDNKARTVVIVFDFRGCPSASN